MFGTYYTEEELDQLNQELKEETLNDMFDIYTEFN